MRCFSKFLHGTTACSHVSPKFSHLFCSVAECQMCSAHDFVTGSGQKPNSHMPVAGHGSGPSSGPSMSLGNWLPSQQLPTVTPHAAEATTPSYAHGGTHMHSMHSRQHQDQMDSHLVHSVQSRQHMADVAPIHVQSRQHQGDVPPNQAHSMHSRQQQEPVQPEQSRNRQGANLNTATSARSAAERKRRQCLLEIERELLRHSSSDEEECIGTKLQLPTPGGGKRKKTACTGTSRSS